MSETITRTVRPGQLWTRRDWRGRGVTTLRVGWIEQVRRHSTEGPIDMAVYTELTDWTGKSSKQPWRRCSVARMLTPSSGYRLVSEPDGAA